MHGPEILVRTLSHATRTDRYGNRWQYHSRSDHHSKVACFGIVFDLLDSCPLLKYHVEYGKVVFGINHEMRDFRNDRKKNLDLVLALRSSNFDASDRCLNSVRLDYEIKLSSIEEETFVKLPSLRQAPVGAVLVALEAKACMTAHQRALPRLYDELNSSHATVHSSSADAIAAGFAMINLAKNYLSPDLNKANRREMPKWSTHRQPRDARLAVERLRQLPRRSNVGDSGFDAFAVSVINCSNDGSKVRLVESDPAPSFRDIYHYTSMIDRLSTMYATRFQHLI